MFSLPMSLSDWDAALSDGDDGAVPDGFMQMKSIVTDRPLLLYLASFILNPQS